MGGKADWNKIENEYVNGDISLRGLAEKHHISYNTLKDRAAREKWADIKNIQHRKVTAKTHQKTAEKKAAAALKDFDRLVRLNQLAMDKIETMIENTNKPSEVKQLTAALADIGNNIGESPGYKLRELEVKTKYGTEHSAVISDEQKEKVIAAKYDFWEYCKLKAGDFYRDDTVYLYEVCRALQDFLKDENELLIINLPPRHGKSRTAALAAEWFLGRDKTLKIIMASYNEKLSRQFSKTVRNDITEMKADAERFVFSDAFPGVMVEAGSATADLWKIAGSPTYNYLATSPKATLTGFGADIVFIDDIVKDAYEANHTRLLEEQYQWFTDTLYSRLEGRAKLIIIMTRWATKDLAGRVLAMYQEQGRKIRIVSRKAFDGVNMLNPRILDKARYDNLIQTVGEDIVRANYDQEPIDIKGKLYGEFITYTEAPPFTAVHSMCDTADGGKDYLCNIIYGLTDNYKAYVLDVYYSRDAMDVTERELVRRLMEFDVNKATFESNFGGKAFVKVIRSLSEAAGNRKTTFHSYVQTQNKEARILANATNVIRNIYMPEHWEKLFPKFYQDVTGYQRAGNNLNDDGPDALTSIVERGLRKPGFL